MALSYRGHGGSPGREKLPYGADYVQPMGSLNVNYDFAAYLRNMELQLVEGQSKQGIDSGNVAPRWRVGGPQGVSGE